MKTCVLLISFFLFFGCESQNCCTNISIDIKIYIEDKEGKSLLDPTHSKFIDITKARIYFVINKQEIYKGSGTAPCNSLLCLISEGGKQYAKLFPNTDTGDELPVTIIKWTDYNIDTIKCHFIRTENSTICDKVWYNSQLVYPNDNKGERMFKIVR